jgi:hypothetical protein
MALNPKTMASREPLGIAHRPGAGGFDEPLSGEAPGEARHWEGPAPCIGGRALYFRGQPAFDDILAEIAKWSPQL